MRTRNQNNVTAFRAAVLRDAVANGHTLAPAGRGSATRAGHWRNACAFWRDRGCMTRPMGSHAFEPTEAGRAWVAAHPAGEQS